MPQLSQFENKENSQSLKSIKDITNKFPFSDSLYSWKWTKEEQSFVAKKISIIQKQAIEEHQDEATIMNIFNTCRKETKSMKEIPPKDFINTIKSFFWNSDNLFEDPAYLADLLLLKAKKTEKDKIQKEITENDIKDVPLKTEQISKREETALRSINEQNEKIRQNDNALIQKIEWLNKQIAPYEGILFKDFVAPELSKVQKEKITQTGLSVDNYQRYAYLLESQQDNLPINLQLSLQEISPYFKRFQEDHQLNYNRIKTTSLKGLSDSNVIQSIPSLSKIPPLNSEDIKMKNKEILGSVYNVLWVFSNCYHFKWKELVILEEERRKIVSSFPKKQQEEIEKCKLGLIAYQIEQNDQELLQSNQQLKNWVSQLKSTTNNMAKYTANLLHQNDYQQEEKEARKSYTELLVSLMWDGTDDFNINCNEVIFENNQLIIPISQNGKKIKDPLRFGEEMIAPQLTLQKDKRNIGYQSQSTIARWIPTLDHFKNEGMLSKKARMNQLLKKPSANPFANQKKLQTQFQETQHSIIGKTTKEELSVPIRRYMTSLKAQKEAKELVVQNQALIEGVGIEWTQVHQQLNTSWAILPESNQDSFKSLQLINNSIIYMSTQGSENKLGEFSKTLSKISNLIRIKKNEIQHDTLAQRNSTTPLFDVLNTFCSFQGKNNSKVISLSWLKAYTHFLEEGESTSKSFYESEFFYNLPTEIISNVWKEYETIERKKESPEGILKKIENTKNISNTVDGVNEEYHSLEDF